MEIAECYVFRCTNCGKNKDDENLRAELRALQGKHNTQYTIKILASKDGLIDSME